MQPTHEQIVEQLDRIEQLIHDHMHDSLVWRTRVEADIVRNTEITEQVRNLATTGRTLRKIVVWVGSIAAGLVGLWQLWQILNPRITP